MIFHELSSLDGNSSWALLVDTSTHDGQLMAYNKNEVLFHKTWGRESKHDEVLNIFFDQLRQALNLKDLKKIVCAYGPGSFTGLRVSATFAKVLSMSLGGIPIYGLSSFHIFAYGAIENKKINLGDDFEVFIPSIGNKTFKSSFQFDESSKTYIEAIDLDGSKEHDLSKPHRFKVSELKDNSLFNLRHSSLLQESKLRPHIQKSSHLDFYPLFLRRSEAEEKLKI